MFYLELLCPYFETKFASAYGLFTLHGNGTGSNGSFLYIVQKLFTLVQDRERNLDQLFPIVLVKFLVPVPVPVPCSVNRPLLRRVYWQFSYIVMKRFRFRIRPYFRPLHKAQHKHCNHIKVEVTLHWLLSKTGCKCYLGLPEITWDYLRLPERDKRIT